jgi:putative ABC transport system permease protein
MRSLAGDLRQAARSLARSPGFTAAAIATLALGIGAAVAIFSLVEASLLRGLPYRDPQRLVHVWETDSRGEVGRHELSYPDYRAVEDGVKAFESVAGFSGGAVILSLPHHAEQLPALRVTASFFPTLGVTPAFGRAFLPAESVAGSARVVMVSRALWSRLFGESAPFEERVVRLQDVPHTIIGVLPAGFHFAPGGAAEVYLPVRPTEQQKTRPYWHWLHAIARLSPGVTPAQAKASADALAARIEAADPRWHAGEELLLRPLPGEIVGEARPILLALAAAAACVLLITCANVATLLLGRSARRKREIGVRLALGATRGRLARFLLTESLLLAALGGALGLLVAQWAVQIIVAGIPADRRAVMPFLTDLRLGGPVLAFAFAVSLLTALACGLTPALRAGGVSPMAALKRGPSSGRGNRRREAASWLVAVEIALTLVLLTGAGLLVRSTARLLSTDAGYERDRVLTLTLWLPSSRLKEPAHLPAFVDRLLDGLSAIPGVESAATVSKLPIGGGDTGTALAQGRPLVPEANLRTVSSGYFATMRLPLRAGRLFSREDTPQAPPVVLVNQAFARRAFRGNDGVGTQIGFEFLQGRLLTIAGVVADENVTGLDAAVTPVVYFPSSQDPSGSFDLVLRTRVEPETLAGAVRARISTLDPDAVAGPAASLTRRLSDSPPVFLRRYPAGLIGGFGLAGLALAAIGVFGVAARDVTRRTREIGIRMSVGATPADIARLVLLSGSLPVAVGLAAGAAGSLAAARLLSGLLFGISPADITTLFAVAAAVAAVAAGASLLPALRAARLDPSRALQVE